MDNDRFVCWMHVDCAPFHFPIKQIKVPVDDTKPGFESVKVEKRNTLYKTVSLITNKS